MTEKLLDDPVVVYASIATALSMGLFVLLMSALGRIDRLERALDATHDAARNLERIVHGTESRRNHPHG